MFLNFTSMGFTFSSTYNIVLMQVTLILSHACPAKTMAIGTEWEEEDDRPWP